MAVAVLVLSLLLVAATVALSAPARKGGACANQESAVDACTEAEVRDEASLLQFKRASESPYQHNVGGTTRSMFKANVVPLNANSHAFPEGNPKIVMCASGGGNRAATFLTGVLRGLTKLDLMSRVDGLAAASGGAWGSSVYMYAERTPVELLGATTDPGNLSLAFLQQDHAELLKAASTAWTEAILQEVERGTPPDQIWQRAAGTVFLKPFGLDNPQAYLAGSKADVTRIKQLNPSLQDAAFNIPQPNRPSTFVILGTMDAPSGYKATPANTVTLQMSPNYIGVPFYPNNSKLVYDKTGFHPFCGKSTTALVGGGMVEAFAFGGGMPSNTAQQSGGEAVEVEAPKVPFTLADAIGISSWAPGLEFENSLVSLVNPVVRYWPVTSSEFPPPEHARDLHVTDGGNHDNSALLPLLMRKPERVVWVASSYQGLNESYPWSKACSGAEAFNPLLAGVIDEVLDKFGYGPEISDASQFLQYNQVFERKAVQSLSCSVWELKRKGKPAVVQFSPTVMTNTWWGIEGGFKVDITLIYLENVTNFNSALPEDTQAEIAKGDKGELANFPIFATVGQNNLEPFGYTEPQVNLLAALGEFDVLQNQELFKSFLA